MTGRNYEQVVVTVKMCWQFDVTKNFISLLECKEVLAVCCNYKELLMVCVIEKSVYRMLLLRILTGCNDGKCHLSVSCD